MELDISSLDEPQEIAHEFEIDLNCVVVVNHKLTLEAIDRTEDEDLAGFEKGFAPETDPETIRSIVSYAQNFYEDLRVAALRLAMVALVTRLQHWIERFVKQLKLKPDRFHDSILSNQMESLNKTLGVGPVPVTFFDGLVRVRDAVIHNDSRAEWEFNGKPRKVADEYKSAYDNVEVTEEQLKEAIEKATQQVIWYDNKLQSSPNVQTP